MAGKGQKKGAKLGVQNECDINWEQVKSMCQVLCTNEEIASIVGCDADTLCNQAKRKFGMTFKEFSAKHRDGGKASIRRAQYKSATEQLNPTSLVWLGKQYLGQSDKQDLNHNIKVPRIIDDIPPDA